MIFKLTPHSFIDLKKLNYLIFKEFIKPLILKKNNLALNFIMVMILLFFEQLFSCFIYCKVFQRWGVKALEYETH